MSDSTNTVEYHHHINEAAAYVRQKVPVVDVALVLGSGLGGFTEEIQNAIEIPYEEIPHMPRPSVSGHHGKLVYGDVGDKKVLCFAGRVHSYEGLHMYIITFAARMAVRLGCKLYIATNAAGGAQSGMEPGAVMVIRDHVNALRRTPFGDTCDSEFLGARHPSCADVYSERLAHHAQKVASDLEMKLHEGVYVCEPGPTYETESEVHSGRLQGGDAFGMSTAPSTVLVSSYGVEVFAMSLCTNLAAGMSDEVLTHAGVKEVAARAGPRFIRFMRTFLSTATLKDAPRLESTLPSNAVPVPLPIPTPPPATAEQIAAAKEVMRTEEGQRVCVVANGLFGAAATSKFEIHSSTPLRDIPHFPVVSSSGRSGTWSTATSSSGKKVVLLHNIHNDGLWPEEATFIAALLHQLDVVAIVHLVPAASSERASIGSDRVSVVDDIIDTNSCHPAPHVRSIRHFFNVTPLQVCEQLRAVAEERRLPTSTVALFLGPGYPTPAETRSVVAGVPQQPILFTITSMALAFAATAIGLANVAVAATVWEGASFSASPNATACAHSAVDVVADVLGRPCAAGGALPALELQPHSNVVSSFQLIQPVTQGSYDEVEECAAALKARARADSTGLIGVVTFNNVIFDAIRGKHDFAELSGLPFLPSLCRAAAGPVGGKDVLLINQGSAFHLGHSGGAVGFPVRALVRAGVTELLFLSDVATTTSAVPVGGIVMISDHVGLSGRSCMSGHNEDRWGARFPDCSNLFKKETCQRVQQSAVDHGRYFQSAVLAGLNGPSFLSAALSQLLSAIDIHTVAPHTSAEISAAKHMGCLSCALGVVARSAYEERVLSDEDVSARAITAWDTFISALE